MRSKVLFKAYILQGFVLHMQKSSLESWRAGIVPTALTVGSYMLRKCYPQRHLKTRRFRSTCFFAKASRDASESCRLKSAEVCAEFYRIVPVFLSAPGHDAAQRMRRFSAHHVFTGTGGGGGWLLTTPSYKLLKLSWLRKVLTTRGSSRRPPRESTCSASMRADIL